MTRPPPFERPLLASAPARPAARGRSGRAWGGPSAWRRLASAARWALVMVAAACADPSAAPSALFEVVTPGLAALETGRPTCDTILEVNGGGVALFDGDDDGDLDLLLVSPGAYPGRGARSGGTNRLYRNDGDFVFVDVTAGSGVDVEGFCNGVAVADVDRDGRRDLYLTRHGPNVLLRNLGGLRFEVVDDAGGAAGGEGWSTSAVFFDADRDGDPDLYVVDYLAFDPDHPPMDGVDGRSCEWKGHTVMCGPQGLPAQGDHVYRNDGGRFVEVTQALGFAATPSYGLGVIDGDFNDDGLTDLYVTNDSMPNFLFLSRGDGTYEEAGMLSGSALSAQGREQAGMGVAAADVDADGDEDVLVTNFSMESNALYVNQGQGRFRERSGPAGLGGPSRTLLGWGSAFLDADLDGDPDLVTANGHVYPQADEPDTDTSYAQPDVLWLNDGAGRFEAAPWVGDAPAVSRALAAGDLDGDGRSDLVVTRRSGVPAVYRGTGAGRTSLQVTLAGPPGNPDAVGSRVEFRDADGVRSAWVRTSAGYQGAGDPRPVFAWRGPGTLVVILPDGRRLERAVDAPGPFLLECSR